MTDSEAIADIERLLPLAKRSSTIKLLQDELRRRKGLLAAAAAKSNVSAPTPPPPVLKKEILQKVEPNFAALSRYAWDQSGKFVKVYVTVPGVEKVPDDAITLDCSSGTSLRFDVRGLPTPPPNVRLNVPALHGSVVEAQSSWTRKADSMVLVKLRKAVEGETWGSLDDSAVQKAKKKEADLAENQGKSTQELLAKMYAEADEEGKASLAAAWEAGRAKREGRA